MCALRGSVPVSGNPVTKKVILAGIVNRLQSMNSNVVQVRYNSKVKGYYLPSSTRDVKLDANAYQQWAHEQCHTNIKPIFKNTLESIV